MTTVINGTSTSASAPAVVGDDGDTGVYFPAANQLALATNGTQAVIVNASQRVGINNATPQGALDVGGLNDGSSAGDLLVTTASTAAVVTVGRLSATSSDNTNFRVRNRVDETAVLINAGNKTLQVGKSMSVGGATPTASGSGLTFPAIQDSSSDANTLDDYEEGTWTPTIGGSSTGMSSVTYVTQNGKYTKIGDMVFITMQLQWSAASGGTGDARVYGLPFSCPDSYTAFSASQFINLGVTDFQMRSDAGTRLAPQTAQGASGLSLSSFTSGSFNKYISVAGCYKVT